MLDTQFAYFARYGNLVNFFGVMLVASKFRARRLRLPALHLIASL
jgi:hypothetical protein